MSLFAPLATSNPAPAPQRGALWRLLVALLTILPLTLPQVARADAMEALELVRSTSERVLERLRDQSESIKGHPERIYGLVNEMVLPHFDFERMARWVLGKNWRRADAAQQRRFVEEFRTLLVRTYATALNEYADTHIRYLPLHAPADADDVSVKTEAEVAGGLPVPVDYSLYRTDQGDWKVYDVAIDGLSLVTNYRSTFAGEIRSSGIEGLIEKLEARNRQAAR